MPDKWTLEYRITLSGELLRQYFDDERHAGDQLREDTRYWKAKGWPMFDVAIVAPDGTRENLSAATGK